VGWLEAGNGEAAAAAATTRRRGKRRWIVWRCEVITGINNWITETADATQPQLIAQSIHYAPKFFRAISFLLCFKIWDVEGVRERDTGMSTPGSTELVVDINRRKKGSKLSSDWLHLQNFSNTMPTLKIVDALAVLDIQPDDLQFFTSLDEEFSFIKKKFHAAARTSHPPWFRFEF
jgi:hypothetical protein